MPRQNRVDPFGALIATECRGTLMGNRGCLHDEHGRIRRPFAVRRWITCVLEFHGRHREVMTPGRYTELFFLDEATALAGGHRPCAECQHERYLLFRRMWAAANPGLFPGPVPSADDMDLVLHRERLTEDRRKRTFRAALSTLPTGVLVADDSGVPYLVLDRRLLRWHPCGYTGRVPRPDRGEMTVLTPPSIVRMLAEGYPVILHGSWCSTGAGDFGAPGR